MYQPYLIHILSIKVSTRFHQLSKTKLGLSPELLEARVHGELGEREKRADQVEMDRGRRMGLTRGFKYPDLDVESDHDEVGALALIESTLRSVGPSTTLDPTLLQHPVSSLMRHG
jgi:hypothetical protein